MSKNSEMGAHIEIIKKLYKIILILNLLNLGVRSSPIESKQVYWLFWPIVVKYLKNKKRVAERGFDPRTSGLWAQHASTAPLCLSWFNT